MAEPLATIAELQAKKSDADAALAAEWLEDASELVRDEGDAEWAADTVPDGVRRIVVEVARRAMENPGGHSQTSIGDVSVSYRGSGQQQDAVFLTRQEHRRVKRAAGRLARAVTMVSPWNPQE